MAETEVSMTYETLFEFLVREKNRDELQKLDKEFMEHFKSYVTEKRKVAADIRKDSGTLSLGSERAEKQIQNAVKIFTELLERRERKILQLALMKVRAQSNIIDTSQMLAEEKQLFDDVVALLESFQSTMLNEPQGGAEEFHQIPDKTKKEEPILLEDKEEKKTKLVRFLNAVPKFLGRELEVYGPFEEEEIATLPEEIAEILIKKGRAEEISNE